MTTVTVFSVDVVDDDKIKFRNILYKNIIWTDPKDNKYFCFRIAILRPKLHLLQAVNIGILAWFD